jgi:hypothetical protein
MMLAKIDCGVHRLVFRLGGELEPQTAVQLGLEVRHGVAQRCGDVAARRGAGVGRVEASTAASRSPLHEFGA